jgi:EAL domain-containing protein (putative c-di-GMP-specific phosphodiesterase class I)
MKLHTIAEFAETAEIVQILRDMGVDYAQGYGVAKPEPFL